MIKRFLAFLSRLTKRERAIFYGAVAAVFLVLLDRLMLNPVISEIRLLDEKLSNRVASVKEALFIVSQKENLGRKIRLYASYLERAPSDEEEKHSFLKHVENTAVKSSVSLTNIKVSRVREETLSKKYFIRLNCEAQMGQIVDFLYKIESSDKLLRVEKYHMSPKEEGSTIITCTMDISKYIIL